MNRLAYTAILPLLLLTAACGPDSPAPDPPAAPPPFADCAGLTDQPATGSPPTAPGSVGPTGSAGPAGPTEATGSTGPTEATGPTGSAGQLDEPLPDLSLSCFTGGEQVPLARLRGPSVVNLWASYCAPCREELPAFQRLDRRAGNRLRVLGVNTRDARAAARSVGEDLGLTFPNLYDPTEQLRTRLARNALPLTLFVDGRGRIRYVDQSGALDDERLTELVRRHLAVEVPA